MRPSSSVGFSLVLEVFGAFFFKRAEFDAEAIFGLVERADLFVLAFRQNAEFVALLVVVAHAAITVAAGMSEMVLLLGGLTR
jgi:hypothetical protein